MQAGRCSHELNWTTMLPAVPCGGHLARTRWLRHGRGPHGLKLDGHVLFTTRRLEYTNHSTITELLWSCCGWVDGIAEGWLPSNCWTPCNVRHHCLSLAPVLCTNLHCWIANPIHSVTKETLLVRHCQVLQSNYRKRRQWEIINSLLFTSHYIQHHLPTPRLVGISSRLTRRGWRYTTVLPT